MGLHISNLSKAVGVPSILLGSSVILLRRHLPLSIAGILTYVSLSGMSVALAANGVVHIPTATLWLGKNHATGAISTLGYVLQWPYHALLHARIARRRQRSKEPLYNEIAPGVYLGGWPQHDAQLPNQGHKLARVDMTAELPARGDGPYYNVPLYDTQGPSVQQTEGAVQWAASVRAQGTPVYVFCQNGHGRSGVVAAALLVETGMAKDGGDAERMVKAARPKVRFNAAQAVAWQGWLEHRGRRGGTEEERKNKGA